MTDPLRLTRDLSLGASWCLLPAPLRRQGAASRLHELGFPTLQAYLRDRYIDQHASMRGIAMELMGSG